MNCLWLCRVVTTKATQLRKPNIFITEAFTEEAGFGFVKVAATSTNTFYLSSFPVLVGGLPLQWAKDPIWGLCNLACRNFRCTSGTKETTTDSRDPLVS